MTQEEFFEREDLRAIERQDIYKASHKKAIDLQAKQVKLQQDTFEMLKQFLADQVKEEKE